MAKYEYEIRSEHFRYDDPAITSEMSKKKIVLGNKKRKAAERLDAKRKPILKMYGLELKSVGISDYSLSLEAKSQEEADRIIGEFGDELQAFEEKEYGMKRKLAVKKI